MSLILKKEAKPQGDIGVKEIKVGRFTIFHYQITYSNLDAVVIRYTNYFPKTI